MSMEECDRMLKDLDAQWDVSPWNKQDRALPTKKNAERIGITSDDLDRLSIVHVSGTKGKGSTCAYVESILRCSGYKTGFFSSPHLVDWRDRIRINGRPIAGKVFVRHFWDCYDKLLDTQGPDDGGMPNSFRICVLMAIRIFQEEQVDVSVLEVGIGGEYDSTNILSNPVACGVTSLGLDHVGELGETIGDIAWHKAGIFKPGVAAFTVAQPGDSLDVLLRRAKDNGNPLYLAPPLEYYGWGECPIELGIHGNVQKLNASLALQLCQAWIEDHGKSVEDRKRQRGLESCSLGTVVDVAQGFQLSPGMIRGLRECRWPGRAQILHRARVTYYLDGAHTRESMQHCVEWFKQVSLEERSRLRGRVLRVLVFNVTGDRDANSFLEILTATNMDLAAFCPNIDTRKVTAANDDGASSSARFKALWDRLSETQPSSSMHSQDMPGIHDDTHTERTRTFCCITDALWWASNGLDNSLRPEMPSSTTSHPECSETADHIQVLCTGSLYMVGGCIRVLEPNFLDE